MSEKVRENKDYLKSWIPWRIKRYWAFLAIATFSLVFPWITVHGHHIFLLSFDTLKLDLMFVQFDMQEMYLMPFLLMILFLGIFGITVLGGRVFCGWMCPQTIFRVVYRDLIETKILKLRKRIKNKQLDPDMSLFKNKMKKALAVLLWTILAFIATSNLLWLFVPPEIYFTQLADPSNHPILIGTILITLAFLIYDIIILKENFCVYVCPYSRVQSVLYDEDTIMAVYDFHRGGEVYNEDKVKEHTSQKTLQDFVPSAECTTCESCVTVCPTHIDIRKGLQLECINCLECVDACTTVMGKLGKPSLVQWSSDRQTVRQEGKTRFFRPKIIGYGAILTFLVVAMVFLGSKKEHMLLNINKETRMYSFAKHTDTKQVQNAYIFLLQNTEDIDHTFYFDVIAPKGMEGKIKIKKPSKPFLAKPGKKRKKVVLLYTDEVLSKNDRQDTIVPITIRAYALDDKKKIVVDRETTFVFPRYDIYEKHK